VANSTAGGVRVTRQHRKSKTPPAGDAGGAFEKQQTLLWRYTIGAGMSQHIRIVMTTVVPSMSVILFILVIFCASG
jgi:hypothetical protein